MPIVPAWSTSGTTSAAARCRAAIQARSSGLACSRRTRRAERSRSAACALGRYRSGSASRPPCTSHPAVRHSSAPEASTSHTEASSAPRSSAARLHRRPEHRAEVDPAVQVGRHGGDELRALAGALRLPAGALHLGRLPEDEEQGSASAGGDAPGVRHERPQPRRRHRGRGATRTDPAPPSRPPPPARPAARARPRSARSPRRCVRPGRARGSAAAARKAGLANRTTRPCASRRATPLGVSSRSRPESAATDLRTRWAALRAAPRAGAAAAWWRLGACPCVDDVGSPRPVDARRAGPRERATQRGAVARRRSGGAWSAARHLGAMCGRHPELHGPARTAAFRSEPSRCSSTATGKASGSFVQKLPARLLVSRTTFPAASVSVIRTAASPGTGSSLAVR